MARLVSRIAAFAVALATCGTAHANQDVGCDFETSEVGEVTEVVTDVGVIVCEQGGLRVVDAPSNRPEESRALRVPSGEGNRVTLELSEAARRCGSLSFRVRREGRRRPFSLLVGVGGGSPRGSALTLTSRVNADDYELVDLRLGGAPETVVLVSSTGGDKGLLIDDIVARPPSPMELVDVRVEQHVRPLLLGEYVDVARVIIVTRGDQNPIELTDFRVSAPSVTEGVMVTGIKLRVADTGIGGGVSNSPETSPLRPSSTVGTSLSAELPLGRSEYTAAIRVDAGDEGDAASAIGIPIPIDAAVRIGDRPVVRGEPRTLSRTAVRIMALDGAGGALPSTAYTASLDEEVPWQVILTPDTTDPLALVLHRSVDGGLTWASSPVRLELDNGSIEYPTVVFDRAMNKLMVLFAWVPRDTPPFGEGTGVEQTPQLMLVESFDTGSTWEPARNLTKSVKDPDWSRISPAGGRGIRMSHGQLAVPVIVHRRRGPMDDSGFAALLSEDGGNTWKLTPIGAWASTWPALAELGDGALMANFADLPRGQRAAMTIRSSDAGWRSPTLRQRQPLPCAGGAGALIHVGREAASSVDGRLVFANASVSTKPPRDLTVWSSTDNGAQWAIGKAILLDDGRAVGAPALGLIARDAVGVLYRSSGGAVVFQRLPLDEVVGPAAVVGDGGR